MSLIIPIERIVRRGFFYNISNVKTSKHDVPDIARKNSFKRGLAS